MSKAPSNSSQGQGKTVAAVSEQSSPNKPSRPGWLEIVVGLVVYAIVGFIGVSQLKRLGLDPGIYGLILTSWTGRRAARHHTDGHGIGRSRQFAGSDHGSSRNPPDRNLGGGGGNCLLPRRFRCWLHQRQHSGCVRRIPNLSAEAQAKADQNFYTCN